MHDSRGYLQENRKNNKIEAADETQKFIQEHINRENPAYSFVII